MILDGVVSSWGRNDYGQLGHLLSNSQNRISIEEGLQHIERIPRIVQLSVGSEHNIALTGTLLNCMTNINANAFGTNYVKI